jgi:hypothetical protein
LQDLPEMTEGKHEKSQASQFPDPGFKKKSQALPLSQLAQWHLLEGMRKSTET